MLRLKVNFCFCFHMVWLLETLGVNDEYFHCVLNWCGGNILLFSDYSENGDYYKLGYDVCFHIYSELQLQHQ